MSKAGYQNSHTIYAGSNHLQGFLNYWEKLSTHGDDSPDIEFQVMRNWEFESGDFRSQIEDFTQKFNQMVGYTENQALVEKEHLSFSRRLKVFQKINSIPGSERPTQFVYKAICFDPQSNKGRFDMAVYVLYAGEDFNKKNPYFFNNFHTMFYKAVIQDCTNHLAFRLKMKLEASRVTEYQENYIPAKKLASLSLLEFCSQAALANISQESTNLSEPYSESILPKKTVEERVEDKIVVEELSENVLEIETVKPSEVKSAQKKNPSNFFKDIQNKRKAESSVLVYDNSQVSVATQVLDKDCQHDNANFLAER